MDSPINHKNFVRYEEPIIFDGFNAIGYFPYEKARVSIASVLDNCWIPRSVFADIEFKITTNPFGRFDNKIVVLFEDKTNWGTNDFAIMFHDLSCIVGKWSQVKDY